ncbi:hypothetical protein LPW26_09850 [Rhodopseudomonas sp. HC1]|uniref:hypothetical protein n=1 Tax=Rhodopseudomonas infernalis TaxID=2897386 RepID=UPI001EE8F14E|nr:hypothetical protein [Rhodopseudomonas infernalis]MCG6204941.1 hypothetical protein [Rhodopseudomonas infernalis]
MSADQVKLAVVGALAALLGLTLALRTQVAPEALTPAVVTVLFAVAAVIAIAGLALYGRRNGFPWLDAAGLLVCAGVAVSILIDPDQLVRLVAPSGGSE